MIHLGLTIPEKKARIEAYCRENGVDHVVMLSPAKFAFEVDAPRFKSVDWPETIMYRTFYPLLKEIDANTLVVVNESLRDRNRNCLTYNCMRHFLSQTRRVLVFQWLPLIEDMSDFMILFDLATSSLRKAFPYGTDLLSEVEIEIVDRTPFFAGVPVETDAKTKAKYAAEREKMFANLGMGDPHTIPRNLYLIGGKAKAAAAPKTAIVARNSRLKIDRLATFRQDAYPDGPYAMLELPHVFMDFADFSALSGQTEFDVMLADLKVDDWYFRRFNAWSKRIQDGYRDLRQFGGRSHGRAQAA
ncbi:hypothetical protein [Methylosinus sp. PW1]|uniref:hypothetical protein n=1 Tax=Methylosinus sp. PW1 TaxID=107636 RepID=UPI0012ECB9B2|nr:hypothetical protein [Methylosinus sp. PW1]